MKNSIFLFAVLLFISTAKSQVRTPTLYVTGTVLSDEKMLVSVLGTKTIEGNVVTAELNGNKTETKTDNKGHAILDFSAIAAGMVGQGVAVIKTFDKNGQLLGTLNTTVQNGTPSLARPAIEQLPKNLPKDEAVTIPGQNLGAEAKLTCGDQVQETLSASDKEMIVFTNAKPGEQKAYVTTPNGVSESQTVNIYSLDFALAKNSIRPKENVQAQVHYESIPVGTKLIFTNKSPETIKMTIPGGENAANECIYTVAEKNGSLPVNITGILRGNFKIALDLDFNNGDQDPLPEKHLGEQQPADKKDNAEKPPAAPLNQPEKPPAIPVNAPNKGDCPCIGLDLKVVQTPFTKSKIWYGEEEELYAGLIKVPHLEIKWFNKKWDINKNDKLTEPDKGPKTRIKYRFVNINVPYEAILSCAEGLTKCEGGVKDVYCENIDTKPSLPADYAVSLNNVSTRTLVAKCGTIKKGSGSVTVSIKLPKLEINNFAGKLNLIFKINCENNESFIRLKIDILNGKLLQESFEPWKDEQK